MIANTLFSILFAAFGYINAIVGNDAFGVACGLLSGLAIARAIQVAAMKD